MNAANDPVAKHYTVDELGRIILEALADAGKDVNALQADDLASVDAFHIRGRAATEELAGWAQVGSQHEVLDVGCGLGGTARFLATARGCSVVGIDLTETYCRVAEMLSARVGLDGRTTFRQASALELPFDDARFDVVWTEHVQMNIADKDGFYAELGRVLKPGGQLAFHDVFAGDHGDLDYPVPWASHASISHLAPVPDVEASLQCAGFERLRWEDKSEASIAFFRNALEQMRRQGRSPVGLHLLMGPTAAEKFMNLLRNLDEKRACVVQAVMKRNAS